MTLTDPRPHIALIPAKGTSTRLPGKNLLTIGGRSLVELAIRVAIESSFFDTVVVSTESRNISMVAESCGARVHCRTGRSAEPDASASDVVIDFLDTWSPSPSDNSCIFYLQPTSPLRTVKDLYKCKSILNETKYSHPVVSVSADLQSPYKSLIVSPAGLLQSLFDESLSTRNTEALPATFRANGLVFAFTAGEFRARATFPIDKSIPYLVEGERGIDIDTRNDFLVATNRYLQAAGSSDSER